jgi:hypothetical protein
MNIVMGEDVLSPALVKNDLESLRRDLTQRLSNQVAQHTVSIQMGRDGLVRSSCKLEAIRCMYSAK